MSFKKVKLKNLLLFFIPSFSSLQGNMRLDIGSLITDWLNSLVSGLISLFLSFFQGIVWTLDGAFSTAINGILGFVGVPFGTWSQYVANNGGYIIPIIFVGILGVSGVLVFFFVDAYGFELDLRGGEKDIEGVEEEI